MKKGILKKTFFLVTLALLSFKVQAGHLTGSLQFSARINGNQEVPAVTTNALGVATFTLSENRDSLCVNFSSTGLSGAIMGMHIHEGAAGTNGGVVLDLGDFIFGNQATGIITGSSLTSALIEKMLNGQLYINVHTAANANGEIRGQIKLETDAGYVADLSGAQQVPAVTTNAYGLGLFNLSLHDTNLDIKIVVQNLSGAITAAHLHTGGVGVAGGVVQDLDAGIMGNTIVLSVDPTTFLADLKAGNIYVNIHTTLNPNGEIRGQVLLPNKVYFDAMLNGAQEVPAVTTSAYGVASFGMTKTFDQISFDIVADGLSGPITGAHLHTGAVGVAGGVAVDLSGVIVGNRMMGTIMSADITNDLIHDLLTGNIYINVHTAANPNGEIRGQVYRLAREGYNILIDGNQEVPALMTSAYGGGMVSVNRDQTDAHFMMVAGGLSGTLDGAHFHNAAAGMNGGVIFDLSTNFMNNGAYGYLKSTDATPFNSASSLLFRNNAVYVNIHTASNPNGEVRGQVIRGEICSSSTLSIEEELHNSNLSIYPNPSENLIKISFKSSAVKTVTIKDISGKVLFNETISGQHFEVNVAKFNAGVYYVNTESNENSMFIKL